MVNNPYNKNNAARLDSFQAKKLYAAPAIFDHWHLRRKPEFIAKKRVEIETKDFDVLLCKKKA